MYILPKLLMADLLKKPLISNNEKAVSRKIEEQIIRGKNTRNAKGLSPERWIDLMKFHIST